MSDSYTIGLDFGTESGRALLVRVADGAEVSTAMHAYPHGVIDAHLPGDARPLPPDWALQHPGDYVEVLKHAVPAVLRDAGVDAEQVAGVELVREAARVGDDEVRALLAEEDGRYQVDEALTAEARAEAAHLQVALQRHLERGGFGAYSAHFEAIGHDGRFGRLPLSAASALMAQGYGYGAEGDTATAALVAAGHVLGGPAHFTEMYAMDFARDSVLLSHMGEGNPALARDDEPVRLVDRELGIGGLGRPPTTVFRLRPGPATLTSLAPAGAGRFRLVIAEGEIVDEPPIPALEMPYGSFRPDGGVRACLDRWLEAGGTHHQCLVGGRRRGRWGSFARMLELEPVFAADG